MSQTTIRRESFAASVCPAPLREPRFKQVLVMGGLTGRIGRGIVSKLAGHIKVFAHGRSAASVAEANRSGVQLYVGNERVVLGGPQSRNEVTFVSSGAAVPHLHETLVISATTADNAVSSLHGLADGTHIVTLENGWDTPQRVKAHNASWNVSAGVAWFSCKADPLNPGYDRVTPGGYIAVEPSSTAVGSQLRELWGDDSLIRLVYQSAPEKRKTIANSMFNGLGIIFNKKLGEVLELPGYKALMRALAREGALAAHLSGMDVGTEEELFAMAYAIGSKNAADHTSAYSMMARGLATEIATMNGAIAREAQRIGITLPINVLIAEAIAQITVWRSQLASLDAVYALYGQELQKWTQELLHLGAAFSDDYPQQ